MGNSQRPDAKRETAEDGGCESCQRQAEEARAQGDFVATAVEKGAVRKECLGFYEDVDACMKKANGRVSECQVEWAKFAACHSRVQGPSVGN